MLSSLNDNHKIKKDELKDIQEWLENLKEDK